MEKEPLTKSDLCWVLVKLCGVILVFQSVMSLGASLFMAMETMEDAIFFESIDCRSPPFADRVLLADFRGDFSRRVDVGSSWESGEAGRRGFPGRAKVDG